LVFSDTTTNLGGLQQTRQFMRVDEVQWPTSRVVASFNNYHDTVTGYAIGADRRFQWDDTNHTKLPIGTTNLVANQSDYSFLTDEQGNRILTLTRIDIQDSTGYWRKLKTIDQSQIGVALDEFSNTTGDPVFYDKMSDNVIRLYPTPSTSVTSGIKFYFQRAGSYFAATDTTKEPGVAPMLHRGYVINAAYDGAIALGLQNIQLLAAERQYEEQKMIEYFTNRKNDEVTKMVPMRNNSH
jgi:hypothetical protein